MTSIVELREMSDDKLRELLENAREEMFNLRFQVAYARLEDYSRLKHVRREIARLETVLHMRELAREAALAEPEIASALAGKDWQANVRFSYEDSAWQVEFVDEKGNELAKALVDLNKKRPKGRRTRRMKQQPRLVTSYEIAG
ncbi:MAG: 50S ribosomal protein L29 [Chloroflexi bacterium]|nr:MAG: 50S ribosomal protein L29 [Chloroflexota bacterium]